MLYSIPIFKAEFVQGHGIDVVSIVDDPATELEYMLFERQNQPLQFKADEDRQIIRAVIMRANKPIYRVDEAGREYYIVFEKETLRDMARDAVKSGGINCFSFDHNGKEVDGVELVQLFIKDTEGGINPAGFEQVEDGSLFGEWKVTDRELWERIKEGNFGGISIEGRFNIKQDKRMSKLQKFLRQAPEVETRTLSGAIYSDEPLTDGVAVFVQNEEGDFEAAPDGDYITSDGQTITVKSGKVEMTLEEVNEEVEAVEDVKEETVEVREDVAEHDQTLDIIQNDIATLTGELKALRAELQTLKEELHAPKAIPPILKYNQSEGRFEKMVQSIKR